MSSSTELKEGFSKSELTNAEFCRESIGQLLDATARKFGIRESLLFIEEQKTFMFMQMKNESDKIAAGLASLGLQKGDVVALWGGNHADLILSSFACAKAGFVFTILNPGMPPLMAQEHLIVANAKAVICFPSAKQASNWDALIATLCPEAQEATPGKISSEKMPNLSHLIISDNEPIECSSKGLHSWSKLLSSATDASKKQVLETSAAIKCDDQAAIFFTAGTTGAPKGVKLSHFQLINSCLVVARKLGLEKPNEVLCCPVPLFRGPVFCLALLSTIACGTKVIFPSVIPLAPTILKAINDNRCTCIVSNPIAFHLLLRMALPKKIKLETLKSACLGGDSLPSELGDIMQKTTVVENVTAGLFLTEAGCMPILFAPSCTAEKLLKSVGQVADGFEVKIVDSENKILSPGKVGEIKIKAIGGSTFLGYCGTTETENNEQWISTGDVGSMDKEGYVSILCQKQDVIVVNKKNIYPPIMEKQLSNCPGVLGIQVVEVTDNAKVAKLCFCVVPKEKENTDKLRVGLQELCKEEKLDEPDYIFFVPDFPRTMAKKVQKFKLREIALDLVKKEPKSKK